MLLTSVPWSVGAKLIYKQCQMVSHTWHLRNLTPDSALTSGPPDQAVWVTLSREASKQRPVRSCEPDSCPAPWREC